MNTSRKVKVAFGYFFIFLLFLAACGADEDSQRDLLIRFNVESASDFALLPPCKQIEIYATLGTEYTDVDHMTVIVPQWIQNEINKHPDEVITNCIVGEVNTRLSQWGTSTKENRKISYSVHALLYKANELDINKHPQLERLFHRVVCDDKVFYDGQLILIYYTAKYGFTNLQTREAMASTLCQ